MPPKPQNTQPPAPPEDAVIQPEPEQVAHQSEPASDPEATAESPPAPDAVITVRVLSAVTIGDARYQPNTVLTLPAVLAQQHAEALDDHPDAIAMALADGGVERAHGEV